MAGVASVSPCNRNLLRGSGTHSEKSLNMSDVGQRAPASSFHHVSVQRAHRSDYRKADLLVEVCEVVFAIPGFDLARAAIQSPVAFWVPLVVLLEPLLVLAPAIDLQHHAVDSGALVSQARLDGAVGFEDIRVVLELAWVADAATW